MTSSDFSLWAACHRIFNTMPTLVSDERDGLGGGVVRFMAPIQADGLDLEALYEDKHVLATGYEDEENLCHLMATEEDFMGAPCVVCVRTAAPYVGGPSVLEVVVIQGNHSAARQSSIDWVQQNSIPAEFDNHLEKQECPKSGFSRFAGWLGKNL